MSSSRRPGATAHPKPPTSFAPGLIISDTAFVIGSKLITIGDHTVVHPRAHVASYFGPTTVGTGCILGERCYVGLQSPLPEQPEGVLLGDYVIVEIGAVVEARRVGEGSILETNSKVCKGAVLGKHCKVGPYCTVGENEVLPDYTVVYGSGLRRVDSSGVEELKTQMIRRQVETLKKLIPTNPAKHQS